MQETQSTLKAVADPHHTAVLVVDVQNFFVSMLLEPPVEEVLPRLHRFIHAARTAGAMIVRIENVIPDAMHSEVWQHQHGQPTTFLAPGSDAAAFAPGFEPQPGDIVISKPRYSAFFASPLETVLRSNGIRTVVVAGLATDVCVSSTARDAFQRDFYTITLSDCAAGSTLARHESELATVASVFGTVCTAAEVLEAWNMPPLPSAG